jgi:hypothetical protein
VSSGWLAAGSTEFLERLDKKSRTLLSASADLEEHFIVGVLRELSFTEVASKG